LKPTARLLLLVAVCLAACTSSTPSPAPVPAEPTTPPALSELLPLADRTVSTFRTRTDLGDEGLLTLEYYRPRPELAQIEIAGRIQRLRVTAQQVEHATGGFLLRTPLEVGRTFKGAFGQVRIEQVNLVTEVPAGKLTRCLLTVEESLNPAKRAETTFCPGIGVAKMVVEATGDAEVLRLETELLSHGPRVDLSAAP